MVKYNNWCDEKGDFVWVDIKDSIDKKSQITKYDDEIIYTDIIVSLSPRVNVDKTLWERFEKYG